MHALQTLNLASLLSQSKIALRHESRVAETLTHRYWTLSKCRCQRWLSALNKLQKAIESQQGRSLSKPNKLSHHWTAFQSIAEEIFISEMLLRNFLAIINAKYGHNPDIVAVSNTLIREHKYLTSRVESLFELIPQRVGTKFKNNLINLSQTVKCSNDFLLGHLPANSDVLPYAFDKSLVVEIVSGTVDYTEEVFDKIRIHIGKETLTDLKPRISKTAFSPDLNKQLASCLKSCFMARSPAAA